MVLHVPLPARCALIGWVNWNANETKSEAGVLTEYFRKQNNTVRTIHPFHSVVAYGKYANDFAECNSLYIHEELNLSS